MTGEETVLMRKELIIRLMDLCEIGDIDLRINSERRSKICGLNRSAAGYCTYCESTDDMNIYECTRKGGN